MKIAIDGPAGAGKSTVARRLASELGFTYIDTGAMYRALTLKALNEGIDLNDSSLLEQLADTTDIRFETHFDSQIVISEGKDVTSQIRAPQVSEAVSIVSAHPGVRRVMVGIQQTMAQTCSVVMDGRDIGEYVLPDADYKFYLTASIEERVRRRAQEMEMRGYQADLNRIREEIAKRDQLDSQRPVGALRILPDHLALDTSNMTEDEVLQAIQTRIRGA
ncbi:MAG: (d)CMP kinase [Syntrophomonadaceae bacterium]|jgi:cytidylate kinase